MEEQKMSAEEIKRRAEVLAKEFCKDWPTEVYHPNDLTAFYEKGYTQAAAECAGEIERLEKEKQRHFEVALSAETRAEQRTKERDALQAEVERLRAEKYRIADEYSKLCDAGDQLLKERDAERAASEELVRVLEKISALYVSENPDVPTYASKLARAALAKFKEREK